MMSTLLSGGLPLVSALQTAGASIQSRRLAVAVTAATHKVCEGHPLARSLEEAGRFPPLLVGKVEGGESTRALSPILTSPPPLFKIYIDSTHTPALSLLD